MDQLSRFLQDAAAAFAIDRAGVGRMADGITAEIRRAIAGNRTSLAMLPSFLDRPAGTEQGRFLALDFGGTNVRLLLVELRGSGKFEILVQRNWPLRDGAAGYDYTTREIRGEQLFGFIADRIAELGLGRSGLKLGHTFSYGCRQYSVNRAELILWGKEINISGMEGQDINGLLADALAGRGLGHIIPVALLNDTVATLLAAAYQDSCTDIASVCGTGHNICYREKFSPLTGRPMILNMESGGFDRAPATVYDRLLDEVSEQPGSQKLEKQVAGHYLGEIFRLVYQAGADRGLLPALEERYALRSEALGLMLADDSPAGQVTGRFFAETYGLTVQPEQIQALRRLAGLIVCRSARLVAAAYLGVLRHLDPDLTQQHMIAIDGSLYEKMPGYAGLIRQTLEEQLEDRAGQTGIRLVKDGSGLGAAIAAATVS
ncbi:hexokinase [Acetonema longum]|uniref:Hexokinase n=1 Tax=Acetonema longum DSM 6540 TaxID=1009370 RepID=F7NMV7_9FIRM|nr:hexokinase [Acetonema longum]EGO62626.1 Hexokinase [Acetonema longum DSM 6540]